MRLAYIQTANKSVNSIGKYFLGVLILCGLLTACGKESGLKAMRDFELAERHAGCLDREPTAPGRVQACKNIKRECERRKEDLGLYVCRSQ